jgi:hypothetical protein
MAVSPNLQDILQERYIISQFYKTSDNSQFVSLLQDLTITENIKDPIIYWEAIIFDSTDIATNVKYGDEFFLKIEDGNGHSYIEENLILVRIFKPIKDVYQHSGQSPYIFHLINKDFYEYMKDNFISKVYRNSTLYDIIKDSFELKGFTVNIGNL